MDTALPTTPSLVSPRKTLDGWSWLALFVTLILFPVAWCSGYVGPMVHKIFDGSRLHWWYFWLAGLAVHWIPFAFVWLALRRNGETWGSIGVDWGWLRRWWLVFAALLAALVVAAFVMPGLHYPDGLPKIARTPPKFMIPLSTPERLVMIVIAVTAGVTEEVLFRGFAITRLARVLGSAWLALPISCVSFLFIHGTPRSIEQLAIYTAAGLAFGVPFILMKCRRLEVLILIHFLIDAGMVLAD